MNNKKLIAFTAAILASFPLSAFTAEVKLYGKVQAELNIERRIAAPYPGLGIDDNAGMSRIGIRATEKLKNDITSLALIEFRIDPSDSSSGILAQRNAYVGLKNNFGTIRIGSFHAPYKTHGGTRYAPFVATHLQARHAGGMSSGAGFGGHNGFIRNAIYYTSPKKNGFQASFAFSPDETNESVGNGQNAENDWGLGIKYNDGPLEAVFALSFNNQDDTHTQKMAKIGGKYSKGPHTISGQIEFLAYGDTCDGGFTAGCYSSGSPPGGGSAYHIGPGEGNDDGSILFLSYQYEIGYTTLAGQIGRSNSDNTNGRNTNYFALGVIHKFSKKTRVFGGYAKSDASGSFIDREVISIGMRVDF